MLHINKEHSTCLFSKEIPPAAQVQCGEVFRLAVWDSLQGMAAALYEGNLPRGKTVEIANPVTGPVYIEGARKGDTLAVEILDISLDKEGFVGLPGETGARLCTVFHEQGKITLEGMVFDAVPMIGCIGTAPERPIATVHPGKHGGNMDCKMIQKGATLRLPVFADGGLLSAGDIHAYQGDGEAFGQGLEIGGSILLRVQVLKNTAALAPLLFLGDTVAAIGSAESIQECESVASEALLRFLVDEQGLPFDKAILLIAVFGELRVCQIVNSLVTARMELSLRLLQRSRQ